MTIEELRRILADLPSDARVWVEAGLDDDHNGWWATRQRRLHHQLRHPQLPAPRVNPATEARCRTPTPLKNRTQKETS